MTIQYKVEPEPTNTTKFVVLRHIEHGNRFMVSYKAGEDYTLCQGKPAYKILAYVDSVEEGQR